MVIMNVSVLRLVFLYGCVLYTCTLLHVDVVLVLTEPFKFCR
jgi:hypothetical protein